MDEVVKLLNVKKATPSDIEVSYEFVCKALEFLLDKECIWCCYPEICKELIEILFPPQENDAIKQIKKTMELRFLKCCNCVTAFHRAKEVFYKDLKEPWLSELKSRIENWSIARIRRNLDLIDPALKDTSKLNQLLMLIYELLDNPAYLVEKTIKPLFERDIAKLIENKKMIKMKKLLPGVIICLFSDNAVVRNWAFKSCHGNESSFSEGFFGPGFLGEIFFPINNLNYFKDGKVAVSKVRDNQSKSLLMIEDALTYIMGLNNFLYLFQKVVYINYGNVLIWLSHMTGNSQLLPKIIRCLLIISCNQLDSEGLKILIDSIIDDFEKFPSFLTCSEEPSEASSVMDYNDGNCIYKFHSVIHEDSFIKKFCSILYDKLQSPSVAENVKLAARYYFYCMGNQEGDNRKRIVREMISNNSSLIIADLFSSTNQNIKSQSSALVARLLKYDLKVLCSKGLEIPFETGKGLWEYLCTVPPSVMTGELQLALIDSLSKIYFIAKENLNWMIFLKEQLTKVLNNIAASGMDSLFSKSNVAVYLTISLFNDDDIKAALNRLILRYDYENVKDFWLSIGKVYSSEFNEFLCNLLMNRPIFFIKIGLKNVLDLLEMYVSNIKESEDSSINFNIPWSFLVSLYDNPIKFEDRLAKILNCSKQLVEKMALSHPQSLQSLKSVPFNFLEPGWVDSLMRVISFYLEKKESTLFTYCRDIFRLALKVWNREKAGANADLISKLRMMATLSDFVGSDGPSILNSVARLAQANGLSMTVISPQKKTIAAAMESPFFKVPEYRTNEKKKLTFVSAIPKNTGEMIDITEDDSDSSTKPKSKIQKLRSEFAVEKKASTLDLKPKRVLDEDSGDDDDSMKGYQSELISESMKVKKGLMPEMNRVSRPIQLIDAPLKHTSIVRKENTAKKVKTKMTLSPSVDRMYKDILAWNGKYDKCISSTPIPFKFHSYEDYFTAFEPLLIMECKAQVLRGLEELNVKEKSTMTVLSVINSDQFHDVTFLSKRTLEISDFDLIKCRLAEKSNVDNITDDVMGIVMSTKTKQDQLDVVVRFFFQNSLTKWVTGLREKVDWIFYKVCNLVTINREYQALCGLQHFSLCDFILNPLLKSTPADKLSSLAKDLEKTYSINTSQSTAIATACLSSNPFVLIQGPPGTGKTTTILGMVGAFLSGKMSSNVIVSPHTIVDSPMPTKILICAPSNAAVDEIVIRLSKGVKQINGTVITPKIIRFGTADIQESAKPYSIEYLVEKVLMDSVKEDAASSGSEARKDNTKLKSEESKASIRLKLLRQSEIICCTLSGSGHDLLAKLDCKFENVIIDEACQAVELSSLIPLKFGCRKCIMIGDPNQLPPTVLSKTAQDYCYEQSLFQRIQKFNSASVVMLSVQYRMHKEIAFFPNNHFYEGKLENGLNVLQYANPVWQSDLLKPYLFFDIYGTHEKKARSLYNMTEINHAASLVRYLFSFADLSNQIGIISPYKEQVHAFRRRFKELFGAKILSNVEINTIDGFQGKEKDIIIVSCVRGRPEHGVGFLSDYRRMNVSLTRAKHSLFILGNSESLRRDPVWNNLIVDARARGFFVHSKSSVWKTIHSSPQILLP